ncbi:mitochondrial proton/calcium exchanger protein-like protein isoform X1 [Tanacetum coccineum]
MAETMEQYMSKTRADYGSGVARPKIEDKDNFELKGQFLKELRTNTFSGSDHENRCKREIKKVNEKVYAAQVGCEQCKGLHYTKDCPLKEEGKTLEEAYYTQFGAHFQGGGYRATAPGSYQRNNANPSYQERRQSMEETLSKFMGESAKRHKENSNLIKEIRASTDAAIRNQGASIKILEIQIGQMSKSISTTVEVDGCSIHRIGSHQYAVSTGQNTYSYGASHINKSIPRKEKDPGSFTLPCYVNNVFFDNALANLGASISVMPLSTYLNLGLGELAHTNSTIELADRTVKYPKGIAENVLVGIGKFVFPIDFIILDMPEDIKVPLILRRPFLSTAHTKIDVFKRKITLRLRRDQVDDLMPTIKEGGVVEEFRARNDARMVSKIFGYPSDCNHDKKIRIDCAYNLKFSCMIDFAVLEDMDAYHDEGMGDVIFGEPFLREVGINARRFEGMVTIYNGNEEVTY